MLQKSNANNPQVQRTRVWIFEALMALMDGKPYDKITVSDIVQKAGIARQTFYRNYDDKDDVVFEHIRNTINTDLLSIEKNDDPKKQHEIVLAFNYNYMVKNRKELKKILSNAEIGNRILLEVQELPLSLIKTFKNKLSKEEYLMCRYKLCYQITGALRVFLDWFLNDMPLPVEKFISMINAMTVSREFFQRNIPNIVIRINRD